MLRRRNYLDALKTHLPRLLVLNEGETLRWRYIGIIQRVFTHHLPPMNKYRTIRQESGTWNCMYYKGTQKRQHPTRADGTCAFQIGTYRWTLYDEKGQKLASALVPIGTLVSRCVSEGIVFRQDGFVAELLDEIEPASQQRMTGVVLPPRMLDQYPQLNSIRRPFTPLHASHSNTVSHLSPPISNLAQPASVRAQDIVRRKQALYNQAADELRAAKYRYEKAVAAERTIPQSQRIIQAEADVIDEAEEDLRRIEAELARYDEQELEDELN